MHGGKLLMMGNTMPWLMLLLGEENSILKHKLKSIHPMPKRTVDLLSVQLTVKLHLASQ